MFSLNLFVSVTLSVLGCVRCRDILVSGNVGGKAVINCPSGGFKQSYQKYLLKGLFKNGVEVIRSDGYKTQTQKGRFSLHDKMDGSSFTVTIHNLTREDAGDYGCGVDRWVPDYYTIVKITIGKSHKYVSFLQHLC